MPLSCIGCGVLSAFLCSLIILLNLACSFIVSKFSQTKAKRMQNSGNALNFTQYNATFRYCVIFLLNNWWSKTMTAAGFVYRDTQTLLNL